MRYWSFPGVPGKMHRVGGLERDYDTGVISNSPENHQRMVNTRAQKIANVANHIPELEVKSEHEGCDTILIGWGGTYGHILTAYEHLNKAGKNLDFAQFQYINPLPRNTREVLSRYKTVIVAELNNGQFATYLQSQIPELNIKRINKTQGQPFLVNEIEEGVIKIMEGK